MDDGSRRADGRSRVLHDASEHGLAPDAESEENVARLTALSEGYIVMYLVDPDTDNYIEYNATGDFHNLGIAQRGEDFFTQSINNGKKLVYPEDLPLYLSQFNKDNVMRKIRNQDRVVLRYRLNINGEVKPVSLRIAESYEEGRIRLVAGVREAND